MSIIKSGDTGKQVEEVQLLLIACGYSNSKQGVFDTNTEKAVRAFQTMEHLAVDGQVGNGTLNALREKATKELRITEDDFLRVAKELDVELAAVKAVQKVETGGKGGFFLAGKPVILFEGHVFWKYLANPQTHSKGNEDIVYPKWTKEHYIGGMGEYDRLERACKIDRKAALMSASYGMFQIMGFNYASCGFQDVFAFVEAMGKNEGSQLNAFASFIKRNAKMHKALQAKDWAAFACLYNGPRYAENQYDKLLQTNYNKFANQQR